MRKSVIPAAALLAAALGPIRLDAQTPRDVLLTQLEYTVTLKQAEGFRLDGDALPRNVVIGAMPNGGTIVLELSLSAGTTYFIVGVCDEDCRDMDMSLLDPVDGETLAEDAEDDPVPLLAFVAPRSGEYYLSVTMYDCRTSYCFFGLQVMRK